MEIIGLFKQSINIVSGSFSGIVSKVISCNLFGKGFLFYSITTGAVNIRVYQGVDKVNWVLTNTFTNLSGQGVIDIEVKGLVLKIEVESLGSQGDIQFVLSPF